MKKRKIAIKILLSIIGFPFSLLGAIVIIPIIALITLFALPSIVLQDIWNDNYEEKVTE